MEKGKWRSYRIRSKDKIRDKGGSARTG